MNDKQTPACFNNFVQGATASARECYQCEHLSGCAANSTKAPPDKVSFKKDAGTILDEMADTFRERQKVYKDNYRKVGPVMVALHPDGVSLSTVGDHEFFHLYSLLIVKLTRFATSDLTHIDSLHDLCVYGSMLDAILKERDDGRAISS
mgnify:FL=1